MSTVERTGSLLRAWPKDSDWSRWILPLTSSVEWDRLEEMVRKGRNRATVYPAPAQVFECFRLTPLSRTKVVILGQDPYHGPNQAHGLAFSVRPGNPLPPSLRNIFSELENDLGIRPPPEGDLTGWSEEGVLLLNSVLTVRAGEPLSHANQGWEWFTDSVIRVLSQLQQPIVFMLWGKAAGLKSPMLHPDHLQLAAPHPSPLAAYRGFFGSRPFSQANQWLADRGAGTVNWDLNPAAG